MKRYWGVLWLLLLLIPVITNAESANRLVVIDQLTDRIEVFNSNYKSSFTFKTGPKPAKLISLPQQNSSVLLYRGESRLFNSSILNGGLVFYDQSLKTAGKTLDLPGVVEWDSYQPQLNTWLIITKDEGSTYVLSLIDVKQQIQHNLTLKSSPSAYQFNSNQTELAITTVGKSATGIQPELMLVNLTDYTTKSFPTGVNPGTIFYINNQQIMVACGGYRNTQKYLANINLDSTTNPTPASLHLIDTTTGAVESTTVGYSPLAIIQDQKNSTLFYLVSENKADPVEPSGTFQVYQNGKIINRLNILSEFKTLTLAASGNICLQGRETFYIIDPLAMKIITETKYDLTTDHLTLSPDGNTGYLSIVNSNYFEVFDLVSGIHQTKLKIGRPSFLGSVGFGSLNFFATAYPPVIGMTPLKDKTPANISTNSRQLFDQQQHNLYVIAGNCISMIDLQTNQVIKNSPNFRGTPFGIHYTPNHKYLVVATDLKWYLFDPQTLKEVLAIQLGHDEIAAPATGFYRPDGDLLVIPFEKQLYLIDTNSGKFLGKTRTKSDEPLVAW